MSFEWCIPTTYRLCALLLAAFTGTAATHLLNGWTSPRPLRQDAAFRTDEVPLTGRRVTEAPVQEAPGTVGVPQPATLDTYAQEVIGNPHLVSVSPYAIARAARRYFHGRLQGEALDLTEVWTQLGLDPDGFEAPCAYSEPQVLTVDLDGAPGPEVVVGLWAGFESARFLVYSRRPAAENPTNRWWLIGCIQHDFNRYRLASARRVQACGRNWLVITAQDGSGTGYEHYYDSWYGIDKTGLRLALTYPSMAREDNERFDVRITSVPTRDAPTLVAIEYRAHSSGTTEESESAGYRFPKRQRIYFRLEDDGERFVFDERRSGLAESEYRERYGPE